tara:strand:+ start:6276 stop:6710 length:435 start_codon:yes stop_codon:yes gene_type:complete
MNISIHFITSILLAAGLYQLIGLYSLWIIVGGYLIDFDHYLWTAFKDKSLSLKKSYHYHFNRQKNEKYERDILHIFHTGEFWTFMIIASIISYRNNWIFFYYMFTITFLGMLLHLTLDFTSILRAGHLNARAISLTGWIRRHKK